MFKEYTVIGVTNNSSFLLNTRVLLTTVIIGHYTEVFLNLSREMMLLTNTYLHRFTKVSSFYYNKCIRSYRVHCAFCSRSVSEVVEYIVRSVQQVYQMLYIDTLCFCTMEICLLYTHTQCEC
jgi:hypothetical protein